MRSKGLLYFEVGVSCERCVEVVFEGSENSGFPKEEVSSKNCCSLPRFLNIKTNSPDPKTATKATENAAITCDDQKPVSETAGFFGVDCVNVGRG